MVRIIIIIRQALLRCHVSCSFSGQDNSGKNSAEYFALQKLIRELNKPVVVHALAFTQWHDFEFLNAIRRDLGTKEGGFQYAEPGDGPEVLKNKMQAIFEAVSQRAPSAEFTVTIEGFSFVSDVRFSSLGVIQSPLSANH